MSSRDHCMPPPLSVICALDNWRHERRIDPWAIDRGWVCAVHDGALAAWMRIRWILGGSA